MDVFDGVILVKEGSSIITKVFDGLKSLVGATPAKTIDRHQEQARGMIAMMPDWICELRKGKTVEELCLWIEQVRRRQLEYFSGFSTRYASYRDDTYKARRQIDEVSALSKQAVQFADFSIWA